MSKQVIGKADKFFTLWVMSDNADGSSTYVYIKNISESLEVARERYPQAEYLDWLRGQARWEVKENKYTPKTYVSGVMFFGKHDGKHVNEIPVDYLEYFYNTIDAYDRTPGEIVWWDETKPMIEEILKSSGYEIISMKWKNLAVKQDEIKDGPSVEHNLLAKQSFQVFIPENINEEGVVMTDGMFVIFPEHQEYIYHGYPYSLPLKNGKAKRIKNKTIEVLDYEVEESGSYVYYGETWRRTYNVVVKDFEVVKK